MALQGTLDTFALPDVLRLLAATKKSGSLRLTSEHGSGTVGFDDGAVRAVRADHVAHATEPVDALFELLRFDNGTFTFDGEVPAEGAGEPADVEDLLVAAEAQLAEWREIAAVVPAMGAWVTLRRALDSESVTVPSAQWPTLVAVGSGATVASIAAELGLTELPVSRAVRDLHSLGVVDIDTDAPVPLAEPPTAAEPVEPAPVTPVASEPVAEEPPGSAPVEDQLDESAAPESEPVPEEATIDAAAAAWGAAAPVAPRLARPAALDDPDAPLPTARPLRARRPRHLSSSDETPAEPEAFVPLDLPGQGPARTYDEVPEDAEELDTLTAAFPGLAGQDHDAEDHDAEDHDAEDHDADVDGGDAVDGGDGTDEEPVHRGALLKFLSSVKS